MRWNSTILSLAVAILLASASVALLAVERDSRPLAIVAIVLLAASSLGFLASLWPPRERIDWTRVEAEQRLWESGPLGRRWLRIRQRLLDTFKL